MVDEDTHRDSSARFRGGTTVCHARVSPTYSFPSPGGSFPPHLYSRLHLLYNNYLLELLAIYLPGALYYVPISSSSYRLYLSMILIITWSILLRSHRLSGLNLPLLPTRLERLPSQIFVGFPQCHIYPQAFQSFIGADLLSQLSVDGVKKMKSARNRGQLVNSWQLKQCVMVQKREV